MSSRGLFSHDLLHWRSPRRSKKTCKIETLSLQNLKIESSSCQCSMTSTVQREENQKDVFHAAHFTRAQVVVCGTQYGVMGSCVRLVVTPLPSSDTPCILRLLLGQAFSFFFLLTFVSVRSSTVVGTGGSHDESNSSTYVANGSTFKFKGAAPGFYSRNV